MLLGRHIWSWSCHSWLDGVQWQLAVPVSQVCVDVMCVLLPRPALLLLLVDSVHHPVTRQA